MKFQAPAQIDKVQTLVDGGVKITLSTPELAPEDMAILFSFKNKPGFMGFAEAELKPEDLEVPEPGKEFSTDKSPSQRLRGVIYLYWEQNTDKKKPFEDFYRDFYRDYIGKLVEQIKEKLN